MTGVTPTQPARTEDTGPVEQTKPVEQIGPAGDAAPSRTPEPAAAGGPRWRRAASALPARAWEAVLVSLGGLLLGVGATWPGVRSLTTTLPSLAVDPEYFAWQLSWVSHAARAQPPDFWTTPAFGGLPGNLTFTDVVLGYLPLGWLAPAVAGPGVPAAVLLVNVVTLLSFAVAFAGAYVLARVHGSGIAGAALAGVAFGAGPFRLTQLEHANVLSCGGMALALALLCRGHGWSLRHGLRREKISPGWVLAGWLVATWQISMGFALGISFAYVLALVVVLLLGGVLVRLGRRVPWWLLAAHVAGASAFGLVAGWMARAFLRTIAQHPEAERPAAMLDLYSPTWRGFLTPPRTSWLTGGLFPAWRAGLGPGASERLVPVGLVVLGLAGLGLFVSAWPLRRRLFLALAATAAMFVAVGTYGPERGRWTFQLLWLNLPGWEAQRTPGRLVIWAVLALALLAAGFLTRAAELLARRPARSTGNRPLRFAVALVTAAALVVPVGLAVAEGLPNRRSERDTVNLPPVALSSLPGPVLVVPNGVGLPDRDAMLWQTDGWPRIANGSSAFQPNEMAQLRRCSWGFPSARSIAFLRGRGIRTVLLLKDGDLGADRNRIVTAPTDRFGVERVDHGSYLVFSLGTQTTPGPPCT